MRNMILGDKLPSGRSWTEELPPGGVSQSAMSFAPDSGIRVLNIKINWLALAEAIKYIVGHSATVPQFNPAVPTLQGPYRLHREPPARHPDWPNLRATKILSVQGRSNSKVTPAAASAPQRAGAVSVGAGAIGGTDGTYGNWQFAYLSIQFEVPKYPIMSDSEVETAGLDADGVTRPEYLRNHLFQFDSTVETQARKGEMWAFSLAAAYGQQPTFAGDLLLRQAKGILTITGYDIHEDYVKLGRMVPTNFFHRLGTLNAELFPRFPYRDQNQAGLVGVQFKPGTLLLAVQPKITPHSQMHPAVLEGQINSTFFPRTVDVETRLIYFDPPTGDTTTVDLSGNDAYGRPRGLVDAISLARRASTLVRGHNLVPLVKPLTVAGVTSRWYAAQNNAAGQITLLTATAPVVVTSPLHGLAIGGPGQAVMISGVKTTLGATLNRAWPVVVIDANTFSLTGSSGVVFGEVALRGGGRWTTNNILPTDQNLLYPYSDLEQCWQAPESL